LVQYPEAVQRFWLLELLNLDGLIMGTQPTFMLLFRDATPEVYEAMSHQQKSDCMDAWNDWYAGLDAQDRVISAHPLEHSGRVVSGRHGEKVVDGPYSEAKEILGGYFMITADSLDEATAIAQQCPNLRNGMLVEVRQVAGSCPVARSIGQTTMHAAS
jgi:hypothetical protein